MGDWFAGAAAGGDDRGGLQPEDGGWLLLDDRGRRLWGGGAGGCERARLHFGLDCRRRRCTAVAATHQAQQPDLCCRFCLGEDGRAGWMPAEVERGHLTARCESERGPRGGGGLRCDVRADGAWRGRVEFEHHPTGYVARTDPELDSALCGAAWRAGRGAGGTTAGGGGRLQLVVDIIAAPTPSMRGAAVVLSDHFKPCVHGPITALSNHSQPLCSQQHLHNQFLPSPGADYLAAARAAANGMDFYVQ
jgi:hypothetical protein